MYEAMELKRSLGGHSLLNSSVEHSICVWGMTGHFFFVTGIEQVGTGDMVLSGKLGGAWEEKRPRK